MSAMLMLKIKSLFPESARKPPWTVEVGLTLSFNGKGARREEIMASKIEKRLGVFSTLATAVLIVVGLLSYQKTRDLIEASHQVEQTNGVLTEVSAVRAAMQ